MTTDFAESLSTRLSILKQVVTRKALAETLIAPHGHAVGHILKCGCGNPFSHAGSVCPESYFGGTVEGYNARINSGAAQQGVLMGSAAGNPFKFMALSTASLTIAKTDTTLASEITSGTDAGLVRVSATFGTYTAPSTVGGAASFVLSNTYTAATGATVQSCALFDASSSGNMFSEINFSSSAVLSAGDSLAVSYTITI